MQSGRPFRGLPISKKAPSCRNYGGVTKLLNKQKQRGEKGPITTPHTQSAFYLPHDVVYIQEVILFVDCRMRRRPVSLA